MNNKHPMIMLIAKSPVRAIAILIFLKYVVILSLLPLICPSCNGKTDWTTYGQIGDFYGGILGTILAFFTVVILIISYFEQRRYNRDEAKNTFIMNMLGDQRNSVSEIQLGNDSGKKVFVLLVREWRGIFDCISSFLFGNQILLPGTIRSAISYMILYVGTGPNSTRQLISLLRKYLESLNADASTLSDDCIRRMLNSLEEYKDTFKKKRKLDYTPFEGHQSRLGHYFRILYGLFKFVDTRQSSDISNYDFAAHIRRNLSVHEQALLLLNAMTPLGKNWFSQGYIERYKVVKNIPIDFFDNDREFKIVDLVPYHKYFEWDI